MTYTLDVRGDQTFIVDGDRPVGLVQPDTYYPELRRWSAYRKGGNQFDTNDGWRHVSYHQTRREALAAVGYHEAGR